MNIRTKIILTVVLLLAAMLLCTCALADERFTIDTSGIITSYSGSDIDLVIPDTIDGIKVTGIADDVFWYNESLDSVTLPDDATDVTRASFDRPSRLTVYCNAGTTGAAALTQIQKPFADPSYPYLTLRQFSDANGEYTLTIRGYTGTESSITIPSVIRSVPVTEIGYSAFEGYTRLTDIAISEGISTISFDAFYGCTGLTSASIPDTVTLIDWEAFRGCANLSRLTIYGEDIPEIGEDAFRECSPTVYCTQFSSVDTWAQENHYPTVYIGTEPSYLTLNLPADLTAIEAEAFKGVNTEEIVIPDGCTTIGAKAFADSAKLVIVVMPDSVTSIADDAFEGCGNVTFLCESRNTAAAFAEKHNIPCTIQ